MSKKKIFAVVVFIISVVSIVAVSAKTFNSKTQTVAQTQMAEVKSDNNTVSLSDSETENQNNITSTESDEPTVVKYVVKSGDTLESIAKSYNIKVSTVSESNGVSDKDVLKVGQNLSFPSIDGVLYTLKNGDNLWDLAVSYDISVDDITDVNQLPSPDKVKLGQQLILPGVTKIKVPEAAVVKKVAKSTSSSKSVKAASKKATTKTSTSRTSKRVAWPDRGTITSRFGSRWGRLHTGIDIAVPTGTSVHAAMSGKVAFSGWKGNYGYLVIIDHGNGLETYYGHNSKLLVKAGESVSQGEVIAKSGSTGNSTGPHTHFEVRKNGTPVNPLNYLN
jgi:murein DD-endopeptidase MepM/ murein hydrolase activator NlpD